MGLWILCVLLSVIATRARSGVVTLSSPDSGETEIDVTFFPGLSDQYEDAVSSGEWHRFLEEEKEELEREEEVIVRLLQEEQNLNLDEPIEFTTQKRVMKQFSDLKKKRPSPDYLASAHLGGSSYVTAPETKNFEKPRAEQVKLESLHEFKPSDIVLLEPEDQKYVAYGIGHALPSSGNKEDNYKLAKEQQERIKNLEYAFEHPRIDAVPDATISRLLSVTPSSERGNTKYPLRHSHHAMRHGPVRNLQKKNNAKDHKERQQFLFRRLLEKQRLIAPEDLSFLLGSDEDIKGDRKDHSTNGGATHRLESLEDWEEDYEYDA